MEELSKEQLRKIMEGVFKDAETSLNSLKYDITHKEFAERLYKIILAKKQLRKLIEK